MKYEKAEGQSRKVQYQQWEFHKENTVKNQEVNNRKDVSGISHDPVKQSVSFWRRETDSRVGTSDTDFQMLVIKSVSL